MRHSYITICSLLFLILPKIVICQTNSSVEFKAAANGSILKFRGSLNVQDYSSDNSVFRCSFKTGNVTDEIRELNNFRFYENKDLLFTMDRAPGSDMYISNTGYIAFVDMEEHYINRVTIHFYSRKGEYLFSEKFRGAFLFGFSSKGNKFGVGDTKNLTLIDIPERETTRLEKGFHFDISEDEKFTAVAGEDKITVYRFDVPVVEIPTGLKHHRDVRISVENDAAAVIGRNNLKVFSIMNGRLRFEDHVGRNNTFRDLEINGNELIAGIQNRIPGLTKGSLRKYNLSENGYVDVEGLSKRIKTFEKKLPIRKANSLYPTIPWPFEPFDELHTVWNYYEQHMGASTYNYLHQGLDLIVPQNEPTYAVQDGIVKCVLTLGGAAYWRLATAETQESGESEGWLYAHLVESTIAVDVGDTVNVHDYLGDIIRWADDWGHIHFARIKDTGTVWQYNDDEWGIVYNPLLALDPNTDYLPPEIKDVKAGTKFKFYRNSSDTELDADSLYGDIDIVAKVEDYIGDAEWTIPAHSIYYKVERTTDNSELHPRTLAHVLNHEYDFYASGNYVDYAPVLFKANSKLRSSYWMEQQRDYYHVLTNSDGDSLINLSERNLAFKTEDHPDGDYRLIVEAYDAYGNSDADSLEIKFRNGIVSNVDDDLENQVPEEFILRQNYPNPFNSGTVIEFTVPSVSNVVLKVYDLLGREVKTIASGSFQKGVHRFSWNGTNDMGISVGSGVYIYRLKAGKRIQIRKMVMIK